MKLRLLIAHSRGLAAAAVAALALGIGITALMFAIVDGTLRRGLPAARAAEIVHLERVPSPGPDRRLTFLNRERAALAQSGALGSVAGYTDAATNLAGEGLTPRRWRTALVTPNTFAILGASAARGRVLDGEPAADGAVPVLLGDVAWRQQFGADPAVVGRRVRANGLPGVIVGVMPPGFRFPFDHFVWRPLDERSPTLLMSLWGRLAATGHAAASERLSAAYAETPSARTPDGSSPARVTVAPFTESIQGPQVVQLLDTMFLAGLGVLAIACANVANLLLARGLARRRDFAIASALGASRARIMGERLKEALALAAPAALAGVAITYVGAALFTRAIQSSSPPPPYWVSVVVDVRVLLYAIAAAVTSALAAAALPAWRSGSASMRSMLADESRGTTSGTMRRTAAALVIVEIALATGVLIAAGLMTKGVARLAGAQYAFAVDDVTTGRVALPARVYADGDRRRLFYETLYARLGAVRGAQASLSSSFPFAADRRVPVTVDRGDAAGEWPEAYRVVVSPGHFQTLRVNLIAGRDFEVADRTGRPPVAIVNLSFALKYARREDLIGRSLRLESPDAPPVTIIGIAPDLAVGNARGDRPEAVYIPLFQQASPETTASIVARGVDERQLRAIVASIDSELPLDRVTTLAAFRHGATWYYRVFGFLLLAFGLGALVLALVGVYAVMSFGVTRRRREIGTRMALGATRADIVRLLVREGSPGLAAGLVAGGLLAAWLTPRLALFLFQVSPHDPSVYAAAAAIVAGVGLAAYTIPALRASRLDPNTCLRED